MKQAIKIESLSKIYRLGEIGTGTISRDIERFIKTKLLKQEDPFLKIGELNNHSNKGLNDIVYSLKDINFEIEKGDTVGIIGRNGAGKSTLLKILSKITSPSTGKIKIRGRVASLLEVGTGFHPELTGRENIYLNGAILGMRKKEISQKFDEIVDFSGVERYIDTPVKRYSSGMYVRLAFAVAAHLESEILIVDEVLAVGDAEFQKKCIGKMSDISKGDGRTILFVSHNLPAVKSLCRTGCFLEQGELKKVGEINLVLRSYLGGDELINNYSKINAVKNNFQLIEISIRGSKKSLEDPIVRDDKILLEINYINNSDKIVHFTILMKNEDGQYILNTTSQDQQDLIVGGKNKATMEIPPKFFNDGVYYVDLLVVENRTSPIIVETDVISFAINPEVVPLGFWMGPEPGFIRMPFEWKNIKNDTSN